MHTQISYCYPISVTKVLNIRRASNIFFKKLYLYITYCFTNKGDKIVKSAKCDINISTSFNVTIYPKFENYDIYLKLSIQLPCYFSFYIYIVEKKFVIKRSNNYFRSYCEKIFHKNLI